MPADACWCLTCGTPSVPAEKAARRSTNVEILTGRGHQRTARARTWEARRVRRPVIALALAAEALAIVGWWIALAAAPAVRARFESLKTEAAEK